MKNLIRITTVLMLLFVGVGFTSCGDDDNDGPSGNYEFIGTWTRTYVEDDMTNTEEVTFNNNYKGTFALSIDGKAVLSTGFDWKASGNKLSISLTQFSKDGTVTYSVSGNTLTLQDDEETMVYTRKK